ncbi:MAG: TonB C-terminal domain-containing protein, partial [Deltaproteobacteria bacterium]|nr:TonB C-terminal domain-containing protein [Nannocystaceae bacterium]
MARRRRVPWLLALLFCAGSVATNVGVFYGLVGLVQTSPREIVPREEEVTYIELDPDAEEPDEIAKLDEPEPPPPEPPKPKPKLRPRPEKLPELEFEELPEPEPEKEEEQEPEPEKAAEPIDFVLDQLKSVEQPDELDEEKAPEQADYLSNINKDVQEQTRSAVTNLEKDAIKPKAAQLEPSETKAVGTANENKVAEAKEIKSQINKTSPPSPPTKVEQRPEQTDPQPKSLLAMRETEHRDHKMAEDAHEALAAEAADGDMQRQRDKQASIAPRNAQARTDRKDAAYRFRPRPKDLVALFGKDANAPQRAEHARESKTKGVWADAKAHYQSPLENMVPEVQVGNQTALRSRKHPFARFIAQMHREIHDAWAWGFLEQLDAQGRNHPLNKFDLWSRVEIVLDRDGTIEKVTTVRHSGNLAFDAAAREVIHSSGPFPDPPQEIRSGNGKIYIHWAFHRDERACGTFGAQPFILDNAGAGDRPDPDAIVRGGKSERESLGRRLAKPRATGATGPALPPGGAGGDAHGEGDEHAGHDHGGGGGGGGGGG